LPLSNADRLFASIAAAGGLSAFETPTVEVAEAAGVPARTVGELFDPRHKSAIVARSPLAVALKERRWGTRELWVVPTRPARFARVAHAKAWFVEQGIGLAFDREVPTSERGWYPLKARDIVLSKSLEQELANGWEWLAREIERRRQREAAVEALMGRPVGGEADRLRKRWFRWREELPAGLVADPRQIPTIDDGSFALSFGVLDYGRLQTVRAVVHADRPPAAFGAWSDGIAREALDWAIAAISGVFGQSLVDKLCRAPWETALERLSPARPGTVGPIGPSSLSWRVELRPGRGFTIWPVGRVGQQDVAVTEHTPLDRLSPLERSLIRLFHAERYTPTGAITEALLAGDLRVVDARGEPVTVVKGRPRLELVRATVGGVERLTGHILVGGTKYGPQQMRDWCDNLRTLETSPGEIRYYRAEDATDAVLAIGKILEIGLPLEVAPQLLERAAAALPGMDISADPELYGPEIPADSTPVVEVSTAHGIRARLLVTPIAGGDSFEAGTGPPLVFRRGEHAHAKRDLNLERSRTDAAAAALDLTEPRELSGADEVAALLGAIRGQGEAVRLEWDGGARKIARKMLAKDLRVALRPVSSWFEIGGTAEVDGALVELALLLRAIETGARVVVVGDQLVEVEESLARSLAELSRNGDGKRISPLLLEGIGALEAAGVHVDAPADWSAKVARHAEAQQLNPEVPSSLRAELREYQRVGFQWLARLAHWAPGALLCDDMGLGKTLQALALLAHRQALGPALVVAPTSVVFNWQRESERFAPDLGVVVYHGAERELAEPGPGAVVLTSWDLLVRDVEQLSKIRFATAVFDEAQAAKNPSSKRSQAARALASEFRLVLTGTPIENRLSDLWSLAAIGVPGLFGGWESFRDRFAGPIERDRDPEARQALARVLQPFVLRRKKEEVARDLPPRQEVVEHVTLGSEERGAYDRERIRALALLSSDLPPQQRRFQVLAALTRLRQLACHSTPGEPVGGKSTKIERLVERIDELREEGRKTLVFSSFVRLLDRTETALAAAGARCLRLHGETLLAERRERVDQFQRGEADVFLISLKAGGTGLNLTAADSVFHLDPWWNPAAEAQAADRAHRIGQDKPVTVYRMVADGTVEEAILAMQADKRELVSAVLDGEASSAPVSLDEIAAILAFGAEVRPHRTSAGVEAHP
jgi:superfamily II DNA or RNA helicase